MRRKCWARRRIRRSTRFPSTSISWISSGAPECVPEIVDAAIRIGAQGVWMQEGVVHDEAAGKARAAGLEVVMDRCILKEHRKMLAGNTAGYGRGDRIPFCTPTST